MTGRTLRVNSFFDALRQILHVLLGVLAQALQIALLLLDVRLELRARAASLSTEPPDSSFCCAA